MSKIVTVFRAFVGDVDAAGQLLADALQDTVIIALVHGTRAPLEDAFAFVQGLKGRSAKEKALQAGAKACGIAYNPDASEGKRCTISAPGVRIGATDPTKAASVADDVASAFVAAVAEELALQDNSKAPADPVKRFANALKKAAKLSDAQLRRAMQSDEWGALLARVASINAAQAARQAMAKASAKAHATDAAPSIAEAQMASIGKASDEPALM